MIFLFGESQDTYRIHMKIINIKIKAIKIFIKAVNNIKE